MNCCCCFLVAVLLARSLAFSVASSAISLAFSLASLAVSTRVLGGASPCSLAKMYSKPFNSLGHVAFEPRETKFLDSSGDAK